MSGLGGRRTYIDWNCNDLVPADAAFGVRINIKSRRRIVQLVDCGLRGIPVYILFGTEVEGAGYHYTEDGLRLFLGLHHAHITALTNRNEWDNAPVIPYDQVRRENAWAHKVCQEFNIPFAISSTLVQDWSGPITGFGLYGEWPGLTSLYRPGEVDGEYVNLHLYSYGGPAHLRAMLDFYADYGYAEPVIVGEFGTVFGPDIPVREMFDAVLSHPSVAMACLFAAERGGEDASQDYGIRGKPAWDEFVQYAQGHKEEEKPMPEAPVRVILVPSIQQNRLYPKPGDGDYAETEADFATWFSGVKLQPALKAAGLEAVIDQGLYNPSSDTAPLYDQRGRITAYASAHPNQKILVVSIHTEGTKYEPNLFGGRYLWSESYKLLSRIDDELVKVHPAGAKRFELESLSYILLDGYPANCVNAIVEVAGDSTVDKVRFLSQQANALAFAIKNGIVNYLGGPQVPPVDYEALYRAEKKRADDDKMEIARLKHVSLSEAAELAMIAASLRAAADRLATVAKELKA